MPDANTDRPLLSFTLIVKDAEKGPSGKPYLEPCLRSVRDAAPEAEIVIVETGGSRDRTAEIAKAYADVYELYKGPRGDWDADMPALDDAAAARQRALELASGIWIGWIDADDRLVRGDEARRILEANGEWMPKKPNAATMDGPKEAKLEEILAWLHENHPDVDMIWCPYFYMRAHGDEAASWLVRERFVKRRPDGTIPFVWRERAHEVLVPVPGHVPHRLDIPHLLWVHEKEFSQDEISYNQRRHYDILVEQYENGEITTRRAIYLATLSATLEPSRRREFCEAAVRVATTDLDRMRARIELGRCQADEGFYLDAVATIAGAIALRPDLPDGYLAAGDVARAADDLGSAVSHYLAGIEKPYDPAHSFILPRAYHVHYPAWLARCALELAKRQRHAGDVDGARVSLEVAVRAAELVDARNNIPDDAREARGLLCEARNALETEDAIRKLADLADFLVRNDEPLKAMKLLELAPWRAEADGRLVERRAKLDKVARHVMYPSEYRAFYEDDDATGAVPTPEEWFRGEAADDPRFNRPPARARWIPDLLMARYPGGKFLDVGPFDGLIAINILRRDPKATIHAVELNPAARARLEKRAKEIGAAGRLEFLDEIPPAHASRRYLYDAIIATEIVEHVANEYLFLRQLAELLKPDGSLLLSTPWGAYDRGFPPENHDVRGHLRAFTPWTLGKAANEAGLRVAALWSEGGGFAGKEIDCILTKIGTPALPRMNGHREFDLGVYVPASLWEWNGRTLRRDGMGASETQIVYMAEAMSAFSDRRAAVFGPVPEAACERRVEYHERDRVALARLSTLVVSRSPSTLGRLRDMGATYKRAVLWLQDVFYPDLAAHASDYDAIVVVSNWHKQLLEKQGIDGAVVISNGLVRDEWEVALPERNPHRFVYMSSPDRGVNHVLEAWPTVKLAIPDAELLIFYGWRGCLALAAGRDPAWADRYQRARRRFEQLRYQDGVKVYDMVPKASLVKHLLSSGVWVHPSTSDDGRAFFETCCAAALEARAAGCAVVAPAIGALSETARTETGLWFRVGGERDPFDESGIEVPELANAMIEAAEVAADDSRRKLEQDEVMTSYGFEVLAPRWKEVLGL